jgi:hypothetical protein
MRMRARVHAQTYRPAPVSSPTTGSRHQRPAPPRRQRSHRRLDGAKRSWRGIHGVPGIDFGTVQSRLPSTGPMHHGRQRLGRAQTEVDPAGRLAPKRIPGQHPARLSSCGIDQLHARAHGRATMTVESESDLSVRSQRARCDTPSNAACAPAIPRDVVRIKSRRPSPSTSSATRFRQSSGTATPSSQATSGKSAPPAFRRKL